MMMMMMMMMMMVIHPPLCTLAKPIHLYAQLSIPLHLSSQIIERNKKKQRMAWNDDKVETYRLSFVSAAASQQQQLQAQQARTAAGSTGAAGAPQKSAIAAGGGR